MFKRSVLSDDYKAIRKSKFFNKKWYLKNYSDVAKSKMDPIEHYLKIGWKEHHNPSLKFDGDAYLNTYTDVKAANMNPLVHYEKFGKKEHRMFFQIINMSAFDKICYALLKFTYSLHLISHENFVSQQRRFIYPWYSTLYKSKFFDVKYYVKNHPEIKPEDAISHYMEHGFLLGYNPSPYFDNDYYLNMRPDILFARMNPLYHYEIAGKNEGMQPKPVLNTDIHYPSDIPNNSVLLFSHELSLTGAPMALLNLAKSLRTLGYFPIVISPSHGDLEQNLMENSIPYFVEEHMLIKLTKSDLDLNCFFSKFKLIIFNTIDTLKYARYINVLNKKILWVHEGSFGYECAEYSIDVKKAFEHIDTVYSVGEYSKSFTDKYINKNKSNILLYGIEELTEKPVKNKKTNKITFGIFGMVNKRKGVDIFVDAVKKLPEKIKKNCEFKVVGLIPNDAFTAKLMKSARGEPIVFTGQMPHDKMMQEMYNTDVVVCSSLDDPMPIVCTEAMQLSKPVICSDQTGTASFIKDGQNSFIWRVNTDELCDIFVKAIKNKDKLEKIGKKWNQVYMDNFTKDKFTNNIKNIMNDCLKNK